MRALSILIAAAIILSCNNEKQREASNDTGSDTMTLPPVAAPTTLSTRPAIHGTWELNYISGSKNTFESLYPGKKPIVAIDADSSRISGNTSCNNFSGSFQLNGQQISFNESMALTRMFCPGRGESAFVETLKKIDTWSVSGDSTLTFIMGDIAMMRFRRM